MRHDKSGLTTRTGVLMIAVSILYWIIALAILAASHPAAPR